MRQRPRPMELGSMIMFRSVYTKPTEIVENFHWLSTHFVGIGISLGVRQCK